MTRINLIDAFQDFKDAENLDRPTLMKVVEDVFKTLLRKRYGADDNFDVIVNAEKGDLEIIRRRMIVEDGEVLDPLAEIGYTEATKIDPDFEVGEDLYEEVNMI
ncbi:MAG TPA: NusA N-terminal domain-containing protein, partial [Chitinophagaceae bacterium]|nr:NusA N-terminal domain-containing protein [Chitinophagaceae bacterium]